MELACELNDNDPWTVLSCAHYGAFCGSIEQARLRAEQSLALSPAPSYPEWGYHALFASCAATMPAASRPANAPMMPHRRCRHGARQRCSNWDGWLPRVKKRSGS